MVTTRVLQSAIVGIAGAWIESILVESGVVGWDTREEKVDG